MSMVSRVLWSPEGLVEVRVNWPGYPRYKKKKKRILIIDTFIKSRCIAGKCYMVPEKESEVNVI